MRRIQTGLSLMLGLALFAGYVGLKEESAVAANDKTTSSTFHYGKGLTDA